MKALKIGLKVDTFIQGVIIIVGLGSIVALPFADLARNLVYYSFFSLGLSQVLSSLTLAISLKNENRTVHLQYVLSYFLGFLFAIPILGVVGCSFDHLFGTSSMITLVLVGAYIIGIPIFLAYSYFKMTIRDMVKVNTLNRIFWDL